MRSASKSAVIAVYSPKGGVGKTTIAVDLAWRCATTGGYETLLWDLDVQGGAGYLLGLEHAERMRAASIFHREGKPEQLIAPTGYSRLSLLSADDSLRALQLHLARIGKRTRLASIAASLKRDYRRIVLDCPPLQGEVSEQIIAAADVMIVPLPPSPLASRALDILRRDLMRCHGRHPPLLPVMSMYDSRRKAHQVARAGRMAPFPAIPLSSQIEQMAFRRAPVGTFANQSEPSQALDGLWRAIEHKLVQDRERHSSDNILQLA